MTTKDAIRAMKGELLWAPEALELSMSWCSHACTYCYANARKPDRRVDMQAIVGLLTNYKTRNTREAKLLQLGYPVNVSNHVDVFAGSNAQQFEPLWEIIMNEGIMLRFLTRGAHKPQQKILDRVIAETPPSVWYISIPMWDDEIRKRIEPQAPSIGYRLDLIQQLKEAGHGVVVGINPVTYEWLPDFEPLIDRCAELGVWGVKFSALYFGRTFGEELTDKQVEAITPDLIKRAGVAGSKMDQRHIAQMMDYAELKGLQTYYHSADKPSNYYAIWNEYYPKTMPLLQDLLNAAHAAHAESGDDYVLISKEDAISAMAELPDGFNYGPFFHSDVKQFRIEFDLAQGAPLPKLTRDQYWSLLWRSDFFSRKHGPLSMKCFAYASIKEGGVITPLLDDNGEKIMLYRPQGWKHYYAHTPELA